MNTIHKTIRIPIVAIMAAFLLSGALPAKALALPGYINTIAGGGDGNQAPQAGLAHPHAIFVTPAGEVYIAETANHRIRKIGADGVVITVAGNGRPGFSGDGGPAISASLNYPKGVAVDAAGNVLIADTHNHRIRKVDTAGVITTVAGNGAAGPTYYFPPAEPDAYCPIDGTTISVPLPENIFTDAAGSLHFGDGRQIWKLGPGGMLTVTFVAGWPVNASCGGSPVEVVIAPYVGCGDDAYIDNAGNVYFAEFTQSWQLRKYQAGSGQIVSLFPITWPIHIQGDQAGNVYVAEPESNIVFKIDPAGTRTVIAGTGESGYSGDNGPASQATCT
jgi:hypothetical protein